jgi:hypothetical protein
MPYDLDPSYNDVASRVREFGAKYPQGALRPADLARPYSIEQIEGQTVIIVVAAAYRGPDDTVPGVGMASEPFPGKTPYTRNSELQNAETSAWGRAIVAALAADTRRGVASHEEARNRAAERGPAGVDPATRASSLRAQIGAVARALGMSLEQVADDFRAAHGGPIQNADPDALEKYLAQLQTPATAPADQGTTPDPDGSPTEEGTRP